MGRIMDLNPHMTTSLKCWLLPFIQSIHISLVHNHQHTHSPWLPSLPVTHPRCLSNQKQMGSSIFARLRFSCKVATHESSLFFYVIFASGLQQQWLPAWWSLKGKILVYAIRHPLAWSLCLYGLIKLRNISVWCKKASFSLQVCGLQLNKAEEYFHDWKSQIRTTFSA